MLIKNHPICCTQTTQITDKINYYCGYYSTSAPNFTKIRLFGSCICVKATAYNKEKRALRIRNPDGLRGFPMPHQRASPQTVNLRAITALPYFYFPILSFRIFMAASTTASLPLKMSAVSSTVTSGMMPTPLKLEPSRFHSWRVQIWA